ncbi:IS21 family transposase [Bradyrhizobium sp. DN5]|uniref:IS21 family transposase n=1 Tax=Bradyrhizobium sp. DN5 TaxID=3056950 RepID=UPI0035247421
MTRLDQQCRHFTEDAEWRTTDGVDDVNGNPDEGVPPQSPGKQLQIDFGERLVEIGGSKVRTYLFVATLGYSRRHHVRAFRNERQESWFDGLESAFVTFGGVPEEVLFDNARALVVEHDAATRTVVFNDKLTAFAKHWGFRPRACAPYRVRTEGKPENGVGYVKPNAIAGRAFPSWEALEAHLEAWTREVARQHGTTGEPPIERFRHSEAQALRPIGGRPPFQAARERIRRAQADCAVEIDGNAYSVPWRLIGEMVRATIADGMVRIHHGIHEIAVHPTCVDRRRRVERRIEMILKIARFPFVRDLSGFDFSAQPSLDPKQVRVLAGARDCQTHLAVALRREAILAGHSVQFVAATTVAAQLAKGHSEGRLEERLAQFANPKLLIIDELGYLPFQPNAAHLFFQLVSRGYERGAILLTSNRSVGEWGSVHHSHVITIRGDSYRLKEKRRSGLLQKPAVPDPNRRRNRDASRSLAKAL